MKQAPLLEHRPPAVPYLLEQVDAVPKHLATRVLLRQRYRCADCDAQDGDEVLKSVLWAPTAWRPLEDPVPLTCYVRTAGVKVIPVAWPWSERLEDLVALCFWCAVEREVHRVRR